MIKSFDQKSVTSCVDAINKIASNEIKYYLLLTLKTISKEDSKKNRLILAELIQLSHVLSDYLDFKIKQSNVNQISLIRAHYQKLADLSGAYSLSVEVGYALIDLGSALTGFIAGVLGAVIGGIAGLLRAVCTLNNPLYFLVDGFFTGLAVGGAIGFRAPKKLLKNEETRQLCFALDGVKECIGKITERVNFPVSYFEDQVKKNILISNFNDDKNALQDFLNSEVKYKIATVPAQFISKNLEGFLGHHAQIIIELPGQENPTVIEFSDSPDEIDTRPLIQIDERRVTGKKLIEMIALHKQLWLTEECNLSYIFTKLKGGENDCFTYVNKILIGTGQDATTCRRFNGSENWIGRNIVGFFVQKLSPFQQEVFDNPASRTGCEAF